MQVTINKLKKMIKEELIRAAEVNNITEKQKEALGTLAQLTTEEATTVISLYESALAEKP